MKVGFKQWAALGLGCALFYGMGLGWNLPGAERAELVVPAAKRTEAWVRELAENHAKLQMGFKSTHVKQGYLLKTRGTHQMKTEYALEMQPDEKLNYTSGYLVRSGMGGDENRPLKALANMNPGKLDLNPHSFFYGGPFLYPLGAFEFVAAQFGYTALSAGIAFYYAHPEQMGRIFLVGRVYSWCIALALLAVFAWFAARLLGAEWGFVATLLFGLSPLAISAAHTFKAHHLTLLFMLLALERAARILTGGARAADYKWAGVFIGLGAGTTTAAHVAVPLLVAAHALGKGKWKDLAWAAGLAVLGYLAANPYLLVSLKEFYYESVMVRTGMGYIFAPTPANWWAALRNAVWTGFGTPMLLATFGAGVWAARAGKAVDRWLAGGALFAFLWLAALLGPVYMSQTESGRFFFLPYALACLFVARALAAWKPLGALAALALCAAQFGLGAAYVRTYILDTPQRSNAMSAGRWIKANVPAGARLGFLDRVLDPGQTPPFPIDDYKVEFVFREEGETLTARPDWLVMGGHLLDERVPALLADYALAAEFDAPVLPGWRFRNKLQSANFPVRIYKRAAS